MNSPKATLVRAAVWAVSSSPGTARSDVVIGSDPNLSLDQGTMEFACIWKMWDLGGRTRALLAERISTCRHTHRWEPGPEGCDAGVGGRG